MNNWKKQFALAMSVGCFFIAAPLIGQEVYDDVSASCDPCNTCSPYGFGYDCASYGRGYPHFGIAADFLWWKPCVDRLDFATQVGLSNNGLSNLGNNNQNLSFSSILGSIPGLKIKHRTVCPEWEPGVKVQAFASNLLCGIGVVGSWTYINPKQTQCARGFGLFGKIFCDDFIDNGPTNGSESAPSIDAAAKQSMLNSGNNNLLFSTSSLFSLRPFEKICASWETCYHDWDVLLFRPCCICKDQVWIPYIGVAGLVVNQKFKEHGKGDIPICFEINETDFKFKIGDYDRKWKSDLNAYGLRIGLKYEWNICGCLKFFGRADASVLAGDPCNHAKRRTEFDVRIAKQPEEGAPIEVKDISFNLGGRSRDDRCYRCYPGYRLSAGLAYEACICDMNVWGRIGYEFVEWHNMPNQRRFFETINPALGLTFEFDDDDLESEIQEALINRLFELEGITLSLTGPGFNTTSPSDRTLGFHGLFVGLGVCF